MPGRHRYAPRVRLRGDHGGAGGGTASRKERCLELVLIAIGTALATGLGAIPVFLLGSRAEHCRPALLGLAAGVMAVAAVAGLLVPALDEGSAATVAVGLAVGVGVLCSSRRMLLPDRGEALLRARRTSLLVFAVLFVHSLPEGFALGTAYASTVEGLALFIVIAIAVQNIPEGTSVAIPMEAAGYGGGSAVLGGGRDQRPAARRRRDRLPGRRPGRAPCCRSRSRSRPGRCWRSSRSRSSRTLCAEAGSGALAGAAIGAAAMYALSCRARRLTRISVVRTEADRWAPRSSRRAGVDRLRP